MIFTPRWLREGIIAKTIFSANIRVMPQDIVKIVENGK
jgi:hypothetical protein